jgi:hypothetical protein
MLVFVLSSSSTPSIVCVPEAQIGGDSEWTQARQGTEGHGGTPKEGQLKEDGMPEPRSSTTLAQAVRRNVARAGLWTLPFFTARR